MEHAVGEQDVAVDDTGTVNEDLAVDDGHRNVTTAKRGHGAVGQRAAVGDSTVDDVILQDGRSILDGDVGKDGGDVLEGGVVGRKDGQVRCGVHSFGELSRIEGAKQCGQVGLLSDGTDIGRDGEQTVNDVDNATVEGKVLQSLISA